MDKVNATHVLVHARLRVKGAFLLKETLTEHHRARLKRCELTGGRGRVGRWRWEWGSP